MSSATEQLEQLNEDLEKSLNATEEDDFEKSKAKESKKQADDDEDYGDDDMEDEDYDDDEDDDDDMEKSLVDADQLFSDLADIQKSLADLTHAVGVISDAHVLQKSFQDDRFAALERKVNAVFNIVKNGPRIGNVEKIDQVQKSRLNIGSGNDGQAKQKDINYYTDFMAKSLSRFSSADKDEIWSDLNNGVVNQKLIDFEASQNN